MPKKLKSKLAINGGKPVRSDSAPPRDSIGKNERKMINEVLDYYQSNDSDPSYQGHFEELYTAAFAKYQGGGFADAVSTGTAAVYLAVQALKLPAGSEVLVSPISDPGTYSAIILNGLIPRLVDSAPGSYNAGPDQIKERCTTESKAILLVHAAGQPAKIDKISMLAKNLNLKLIEDCSQAHGAHFNGQKVGTFGDISAFSTMYKKAHNTGGSGGVVYATDEKLFRTALAAADRGKPRWQTNFDDRDPSGYLFPALNFHSNEISCGIGISSLKRLPKVIEDRLAFSQSLEKKISTDTKYCKLIGLTEGTSPFFLIVKVDSSQIGILTEDFAKAIAAEGIGLNPSYKYVASQWPWLTDSLADNFDTPNARQIRDESFNIYVNENYGHKEQDDIIAAIQKVENSL